MPHTQPPTVAPTPPQPAFGPSDVSKLSRRARQRTPYTRTLGRGERLLIFLTILGMVTVAVSLVLDVRAAGGEPVGVAVALHFAAGLILAGLLAASLSLLQRNSERLTELRDVASDLGVGDLSARASTEPRDDYGQLGLALNVMADRIGRLLQAQRDLLAGVSHELRSPLARIEVGLELIRIELARGRAAAPGGVERRRSEGDQLVEEIEEEVHLLERHISRLLDAQRVGTEGALPRRSEVLVDGLVQAVLNREQRRLDRLGWTLETALTLGGARLMGDENALDRVVSTLVENAVQHAGEGTSPDGRTVQRALRVETGRDDAGNALIRIMDRGLGLTPEESGLVFEAFFRTDRSRSTTTGGTGLGLYLVKKIAEAHGGQAKASAREGGGLIIALHLPLQGSMREAKETIRMSLDSGEIV